MVISEFIMTPEEALIYERLSRRGFMGATAAATFHTRGTRAPVVRQQPKNRQPLMR